MSKYRRTKYLVKTGLQLRYMGIIIIAMLIVAFLVGWITYYVIWHTIANTSDFTLYSLPSVFESINQILVEWVFVFIAVIGVLSIFISHRIAGPVYRLEQTTKLIASGDLTYRIHLRSGDELVELQDAFNKMTDSLTAMITKDREVVARLISTGDNLKNKISSGNLKSSDLEEIKNELESITEELQTLTSTFKINETQEQSENLDADSDNMEEQTENTEEPLKNTEDESQGKEEMDFVSGSDN